MIMKKKKTNVKDEAIMNDGNNRYRHIDLQQVYLLQSEALKYLLSCLFASTFAHKAVSSTDIVC